MTLYEITNEYLNVKALLENDEADEKVINDTLDAYLGADIDEKADGYAIVIKELEGELAKWKTEKDRIAKHCQTLDNNISRMKTRMLEAMTAMDKPEIKTDHFKISIAKNGGQAPLKYVPDAPIPDAYKRWEPDANKIREAITLGLDDVSSFAYLGERGTHINIR